ncbi:MAG: hypothetical protein KJ040_00175 [Gammaproteobacteria bacterium]|nr:hypothetical protein [Gammaproteobacteria bacterium]
MIRAAVLLLHILMIISLPSCFALSPLFLIGPLWGKLLWVMGSPMVFILAYVLVAGLLSLPHQRAIVPGRFPRTLDHPLYFHRRLYGLCWTAVYYCTPIYFVCLSVPLFKKGLFRLFGYRGDTDFTIYPDTWVRDLPLLSIGKGAYISNRATIGTNVVLRNGMLVVDRVTIGANAVIGHLVLLAPGTSVGDNAEVGVSTALALSVQVGSNAKIGPCSDIDNGVRIGSNAVVGSAVYLGPRTTVFPHARVASGVSLPSRSIVHAAGEGCTIG